MGLSRLVTRGQFFATEDGEQFSVVGLSSFDLLFRIYDGQDVSPVLRQSKDLGFNLLRIWTLYDVPALAIRFLPWEHPRFYDDLPAALQQLEPFGLYAMPTAFTGTSRLLPTLVQQQDHLDAVENACAQVTNVAYLEVGNEWEQGDNRWRLDLRWPRGRVLLSGGSVGSDTWPTEHGLPVLDVCDFHSNDAPEWWRKVGHEAMEIAQRFGVPCVASENTKPHTDPKVEHFEDAAAGAALLCAGAVYHCRQGRTSEELTGQDLEYAQAWLKGARSVPLDCQDGGYEHLGAEEDPNQHLRIYRRGGRNECRVVIRGKQEIRPPLPTTAERIDESLSGTPEQAVLYLNQQLHRLTGRLDDLPPAALAWGEQYAKEELDYDPEANLVTGGMVNALLPFLEAYARVVLTS